MKKRLYHAFAPCIAVIFALALGQPPSASAVAWQKDAPRQQVKTRKKTRIIYVCPMHLDVRSSSRGTCPKCLMKLVPKGRSAQ